MIAIILFVSYNIFMKDLHIHTKYSDGSLNEYEVIKEVEHLKIKEFAIADHDTIEGSKKVFDILKAKKSKLKFHSSVELTCRVNEYQNGINVHLLARDFDYTNPIILEIVEEISKLRFKKIQVMVDYIEKEYNIKIPKALLEEKIKSTNSFGKPHLLSVMQGIGNFDRFEYYKTMDKLDTSKLKLDAKSVIQKLKGIAKVFLAHPCEVMDEYDFNYEEIEEFIKYLKSLGLTGVETYHSKHTKEMQKKFSKIAKKYHLEESYGSDFHGEEIKPGLKIGDIVKK